MKLEGYLIDGRFYRHDQIEGMTFSDVNKPVPVYSGDLKEFAKDAISLGMDMASRYEFGQHVNIRQEIDVFYIENVTE